jgi:hypothetical protein
VLFPRPHVGQRRRVARLSRSVEQRNIVFEMARTWHELAENAARLEQIESKRKRNAAA